MAFLNDFLHWLKIWRVSVCTVDALSSQTFQSLIITTESFLLLIPYLFKNYKIDYILLSKFRNDNLEARFSTYRQLSGANYYLSYIQVLENERKLRFKNAVLLSANNIEILLKTLVPVKENCDYNMS